MRSSIRPFLALIASVAAFRLVRAGMVDSMDFDVYWRAAHRWAVEGISPYLAGASERGFYFKYPPWILPLFLPFGFLETELSRIFWAVGELLCLAYSVRRLNQLGVSWRATLVTLPLFWWIWLGHFYAGQITLLILACALWAVPPATPGKLSFLTTLLSAKVFSVVSLLGQWRGFLKVRTWIYGGVIFVGANAVVFAVYALKGTWISPIDFYLQWMHAAAADSAEIGGIFTGQMNHGFTAGVLRAAGLGLVSGKIHTLVSLGLATFFSILWMRFSRGFDSLASWSGWLALGVIIHPLAWHHSFVLAYPLCAVSLDRGLIARNRVKIGLALLGIACIGLTVPNLIGLTLAKPLELACIKSWGVVISAVSLCLGSL